MCYVKCNRCWLFQTILVQLCSGWTGLHSAAVLKHTLCSCVNLQGAPKDCTAFFKVWYVGRNSVQGRSCSVPALEKLRSSGLFIINALSLWQTSCCKLTLLGEHLTRNAPQDNQRTLTLTASRGGASNLFPK